jgi:hypothetical protein
VAPKRQEKGKHKSVSRGLKPQQFNKLRPNMRPTPWREKGKKKAKCLFVDVGLAVSY